ncbi:MAG: PQQ-binding-like beta-propeller repeat protein [Pirellulaceae bacterium]
MTNLKRHAAPLLLLTLLSACNRPEPIDEVTLNDASLVENAPHVEAADADWPWWRGPKQDGKATGSAPVKWSERNNLLWKTPIPGRGHASPAVAGDQIFLATADDQAQTQSLVCLSRDTGAHQWTTQIHQGGFMGLHHDNSHASATPACDGQRVYCAFMVHDGVWLTAVDLQGEIVWQKKVSKFVSRHGYGSSPVLYKSLVIVVGDNSGGSFLAALHADSGEVAWMVRRQSEASFGTPVVAHVAGKDQLLMSGHKQIISYNPVTGEKLWTAEGPSESTANTVAWNDDLVFATGGHPQTALLAVRADGSGEVAWRSSISGYVPSPLVVGDRLLIVQDRGVAHLLDASSGDIVWSKRLGGNFYASPVAAGEHIYVPNRSGMMLVFKAGDQYEEVAENFLATGGEASPVICGGRIYIRTSNHLFCIGRPTAE